jgi:uncharacterized protein (TIRG00374 family)
MIGPSRSLLKYLLSGALAILLLYITFRGTEPARLIEAMRSADYWWILVMFACLMASHGVRAWRWRYLLNPIKPRIGMRNLFSAVVIGYLVNNFLPRAGELARPYALGKAESISKSAALGTIVVERILDTLSFLLLVVLIPAVYSGPLVESFPWLQRSGIILSIGAVAAIFVLSLLMLRRDWADGVLSFAARVFPLRFRERVQKVGHAFLDGFLFVKDPRSFFAIAALSVVVWGLYILMTYVAFVAFGFEEQLGLGAALVVLAISSIGVAVPTPGATGSYHMFATQALTLLFGLPSEVALSYATVTHAAGFIGGTLVGLYFLFKDHIRVSEVVTAEHEEVR